MLNKLEKNEIPEGIHYTKYKYLNQILINEKYEADEINGVRIREEDKKGNINYTPVCGAISIIKRRYEVEKDIEYITIQFLNKNKLLKSGGSVKDCIEELTFRTSQLTNGVTINILQDRGFAIYNRSSYEWFIRSMLDAETKAIFFNLQNNKKQIHIVDECSAAQHFGFIKNANGDYIFDKCYRKKDIILDVDPAQILQPIDNQKGDLESWRNFMYDFTEACSLDYIPKILTAINCAGFVLPFVPSIPNPIFCFSAASNWGKGFAVNMCMTAIGNAGTEDNNGTGCLRTSQDSGVAFSKIASQLYNLPMYMTEIQGILNNPKQGIQTIKDLTYNWVQGSNGARAQVNGELRDNMNTWRNPLIWLCEQNIAEQLMDGEDNRVVTINAISRDNQYLVDNFAKWGNEARKNYGFAVWEFVEKLLKYRNERIETMGENVIEEEILNMKPYIIRTCNCSDKKANTLALILYTYNKLCEFEIAPENWKPYDIYDIKDFCNWWICDTESKDTQTKVLEIWFEKVKGDISFPEKSEKISKAQYEERAKSKQQIIGRKELIGDDMYVYISPENLENQLNYIAKQYNYPKFIYSKKSLIDRGIILKNEKTGRYTSQKTNITRTAEMGRENVFVLHKKLNETNIEIDIDKIEEELKKEGL